MELIDKIFGIDQEKLLTYQMVSRAILVFFISLALVRVSGIRTLGKQTAFDNLTALMLGAIMGRAVVSAEQPFFGSIIATFVIMILHRLLSWLTFHSKKSGVLFKGNSLLLIKDGKKIQKNLARTNITEEDILESLRRDINIVSLDKIKEVYLERSGDLSFIKK